MQDEGQHEVYEKYEALLSTCNRDDYFNDLHIEILAILYRCELKLGQELQVIHNQTTKLMQKQGLVTESEASTEFGSTTNSKFSKKYTKNINKSRKEFKAMQQSYKEGGKVRKS